MCDSLFPKETTQFPRRPGGVLARILLEKKTHQLKSRSAVLTAQIGWHGVSIKNTRDGTARLFWYLRGEQI